MIEVKDLRKSYGSLAAVDGVSFTIRQGETFGLLGPNGAGKTTTIHLMLGVLTPDSGSVGVNGGADPARADIRRQIGFAPQAQALYPDLTGEENLAFFARLYGLSGRLLGERVRWALEFAGLTDRRKDPVKNYSGGMQRRLNLAVAVVHDPQVLFLDEPTVGVDPQSRNHIFDSIEALKKLGRTILYTTHYMEEAQRLCDRVAIMDRGKILALDTVDGLIERHGGHSLIRAELESVPADASALPGRLEGATLIVETRQPLEEVARLAQSGLKLAALQVVRPNLETVFLELTGRSLRDQ
jgi:ABC-2 type transport system ATP-binding protein